MTHIKPDGVPLWLWLRWIAERVWMRDWPVNWATWKSIEE
jgi:hypothetical protein